MQALRGLKIPVEPKKTNRLIAFGVNIVSIVPPPALLSRGRMLVRTMIVSSLFRVIIYTLIFHIDDLGSHCQPSVCCVGG